MSENTMSENIMPKKIKISLTKPDAVAVPEKVKITLTKEDAVFFQHLKSPGEIADAVAAIVKDPSLLEYLRKLRESDAYKYLKSLEEEENEPNSTVEEGHE